MNEQGENNKSRREFLTKGLTAFAYAAPVVAVLTANHSAEAAAQEPAQRMRMHMMGHGKHG